MVVVGLCYGKLLGIGRGSSVRHMSALACAMVGYVAHSGPLNQYEW